MKAVSAVIVAFNSERVIGRCLRSCLSAGVREVIVVDNASQDATCAVVRQYGAAVRLIANAKNLGFAGAANQGFQAAVSPLVLLLNPDTELLAGLPELAAICGRAGVGAAGGMLVDERGVPQRGFNLRRFPTAAALSFEALGVNRLWPENPVNRTYRCLDADPSVAASVEQPAGAFLLVRREVWTHLGGFDERFRPVWFEDVDFCKRLCDAGYTIQYLPSARARHIGGHSTGGLSFECRQVYWYASLLKYASKHLTRQGNSWVSVAVMLGSVPRLITGMMLERNLQPIAVFGKVVRLAIQNLVSGRPGELLSAPDFFDKSRRRSRVAQNSTVE
jgi:GT2 family glycosyltransferase